jgi:HlyD family secretion protein
MSKKLLLLARVFVLIVAGTAAAWWFDLPARLGGSHEQASHLTLYGNVDIRQVQLGFRVGGRVEAMAFEEGDQVGAGAVLSRLDARPYEDAAEAATAQVTVQSATVAERSADLENAELAFERVRQLRRSGTTSQAALDQAQAAKDMAAARVASARAALKAAEANLSAAQTSLQDTQLRAPADGIILSRVREPGAIVSPSDTIYVLSLTQPVWVRTYVSEPYLGKIHPGMEVTVVTDSAPKHPYRGRVGFISPVAEFTPKSVETPELRTDLVYRLRVIVDQADVGLRQGMPVTVHIPLGIENAQGRS